jgi:NAD(P) transhydrogenase subunit alpha
MKLGVPKETFPGERRVALVPSSLPVLAKKGLEVVVESGAGEEASYPDREYAEKGGAIVGSRQELFEVADILVEVRGLGANPQASARDRSFYRPGQVLVGIHEPVSSPEPVREAASRGVTILSLDLMPRVSRTQAMDVLSSMATIAGYRAALLAASHLPRLFPMLMTAAGSLPPAKVLVIGAGVAGLQAIATCRRLGAAVHGYDLRPAAREQILSLGAKCVELPVEASEAEDKSGYARAQDEAFYQRQREHLARFVAASDVVITTAQVPGQKAPLLIGAEAVARMAPGSVIVDLAAEREGNCELTRPGETVVAHGVTVIGPVNLASTVPQHASFMFSRNLCAFLDWIVRDGSLWLDTSDEIVREVLVARDGEVVHPRVAEAARSSRTPA